MADDAVSEPADREHVMELIRTVLAERPHVPDQLSETTTLDESGIDSLDLIVVLSRFEEKWDVPYSGEEADWASFDNLGHLADTLVARARTVERERR
ncbi:acyl carrier protein [Streptomyces sp. BE308]|uniref:acyl carrier protein n=1 Tax=unclassified Streptomyces TaxID=2593676 RepID=UPI002DDB7230|nr:MULTISPECIES: acyl carrier protein [unclassified Streptomyces]MEE1794858.1 acyl carrier protein [Streptomyces sp. BE308]WRZ70901.1 acyl carrier protein [Streptomyces sp. NBC_01237]